MKEWRVEKMPFFQEDLPAEFKGNERLKKDEKHVDIKCWDVAALPDSSQGNRLVLKSLYQS